MTDFKIIYQLIDGLRATLDIMIVWIVVYYLLKVFKNNARTMQIMKGIIYVFIAKLVASVLNLSTFNMVLEYLLNWGFLAVIVIFQPEIRSILERMGKTSRMSRFDLTTNQKQQVISDIVSASHALSETRTGALITLEMNQSLEDYIKTGIKLDAQLSKELLTSLFVTTTPLHDGAVIIRGDQIACASAYYLPTNSELTSRFGARHRAALGVSEVTDSVTIVISEETGSISIAQNGQLTVVPSMAELSEYLDAILIVEDDQPIAPVPFWKKTSLYNDKSEMDMKDILNRVDQESEMKLPLKHIQKSKNKNKEQQHEE